MRGRQPARRGPSTDRRWILRGLTAGSRRGAGRRPCAVAGKAGSLRSPQPRGRAGSRWHPRNSAVLVRGRPLEPATRNRNVNSDCTRAAAKRADARARTTTSRGAREMTVMTNREVSTVRRGAASRGCAFRIIRATCGLVMLATVSSPIVRAQDDFMPFGLNDPPGWLGTTDPADYSAVLARHAEAHDGSGYRLGLGRLAISPDR